MEAGNRAAGHGDEQDREQVAQAFVVEAGVHGQVHGGVGDQDAQHRARDHTGEHEGGHGVARLFEQPHGQHGGEEDVDEGDVEPGFLAKDQRHKHAEHERGDGARQRHARMGRALELEAALHKAEQDGKGDEEQRDAARRAVGFGRGGESAFGVIGVEGTGDHIGKRGDDKAAEQPAENQEQLAAEFADVFFNQQAHGFAFVLDAGVQRAEVCDGAEEDAAQDDPQENGQPAERGGLDGAGDGACARNGAELVAENGPAVSGDIVFAVVLEHGGGLGVGVDAPAARDPAAIQRVSRDQAHRRNEYDHKCVHAVFLPLFSSCNFLRAAAAGARPHAKRPPPLPQGAVRPALQRRRPDRYKTCKLPRYHFACRPVYQGGHLTAAKRRAPG